MRNRPIPALTAGAIAVLLALGACASGSPDSPVESSAQTETSTPGATATQAATATPPAAPATKEAEAPTVPEPTATPSPTPEPFAPAAETPASESACVTLASFDSAEANAEWLVVNDNVMGGRSLGDRSFTEESMIFAGAINTDGGGFSSLRLFLPAGALADADRVTFRGRSDGRSYMLTFDDALEGRNRRISFRAPLAFTTTGEWETVTVKFADLWAAIFGQQVEANPFRPDLATRIGIMLSDGTDGAFTLEVDQIQACGPPR